MAASKTPAATFGGLPRTSRMFQPTSRNGDGKNSKCHDSQRMLTRPSQARQLTPKGGTSMHVANYTRKVWEISVESLRKLAPPAVADIVFVRPLHVLQQIKI